MSLIPKNTPASLLVLRVQAGLDTARETLRSTVAPLLRKPQYRISITHGVPEDIPLDDPLDAASMTRDQLFQFTDLLHRRKVETHDLEAIFNPSSRDIISRVTVRIRDDHRAMELLGNLKSTLCQDTRISVVAL